MNVIPLDASLVKGSHGRVETPENIQPILITRKNLNNIPEKVQCQKVRDVILEHLFA